MSEKFNSDQVKTLPKRTGVYLMKDKTGQVIYVGKAKNLRARVRSYFAGHDSRYSVPFLLEKVFHLETIVTENENQALVLEADLIKKFKPRYNIRLKDDKAHLIVRIDLNQEWPRIELVREVVDDGARYIGPFVFGYELKAMLETIRTTVPLRTCSDRVMINRVRPCLEYQMKRCAGPCCLDVDRADYLRWIEQAIQILEGRNREVILSLEAEMDRASEELRFEDAAVLRDRLEILTKSVEERPTYQFSDGARDAVGIYREGDKVEFSVLSVRRGRLFAARSFGFTDVVLPNEEVLEGFLSEFFKDELPDEILLPLPVRDVVARSQLYTERKGRKVLISVPRRGDKQRLLQLAQENARENFISRYRKEGEGRELPLPALKYELGLDEIPRTMECIDISHFQGGSTVASVVFFQDGYPDKSRYRRFNLTQEGKPDDFASMREVVRRHLSRAAEENTLPDLIVIDGGPAQLSQALAERDALGLNRPVMIGLAKRRGISTPYLALTKGRQPHKPERVYLEGRAEPIVLKSSSKALHLLERIRDEAHRFAVTFHRARRSQRMFRSSLEGIQGLGERRRVRLLAEFGSIKGIREADPQEIATRCGIPLKLALRVQEVLRQRQSK